MNKKFAVIGDGGMGTVCAIMLAENGNPVKLWSAFEDQANQMRADRENLKYLPGRHLPDNIEIVTGFDNIFDDVDYIISAVPTQFLRAVWSKLKSSCPANMPICSVTKGVENDTLLRPTEILLEVLETPDRPILVLSGPSIAPEIADRLPATVTIASSDQTLAEQYQKAISTNYFRAYTNSDIVGVELAGATKNVIAIAAGAIDGLKLGDNAKAALLSRGLAEIVRLGIAAGAKPETFYGLSGVGDLVTTCISAVGRNRSFGELIGKGMTVEQALAASAGVVEGVATTKSVVALAEKLNVEMPLVNAISKVLFDNVSCKVCLAELMQRPLKAE